MWLRFLQVLQVAGCLLASVAVAGARSGPNLVIGLDDDTLKWTEDTGSVVGVQRDLEDEVGLSGWQSGLLYADGEPKPTYAVFKAEVAAVAAGQVDCSRFASSVSGAVPSAALSP
jgi:hypothetical protein